MLTPKEITVFGGTGFIGRHVVRRLAKTGAIIRVPTREPEKALILKPMGDIGKIVPIFCSARSEASVANAIGNSDAVINLIGILYEKGPNTFQTIHVETAARIARLAKEGGAKHFIHMSALGASETASSAYARSKAAGEQAARLFFPDVTVMRPSIVFGPEDNFFNLFATLARYLPFLPLIGGGVTKFQPVYAGDVAEAIAQVLHRPEVANTNYEIGGPRVYTFRELIELIFQITGRTRRLIDLSWKMAKTHAALHELLPLPRPLITRDQVELLKTDNILRSVNGLYALGVAPTAAEVILPTYLDRFRKDAGGEPIVTERKPRSGDEKEGDAGSVTPHTNVAVKTKPATKKPSMYKVLLLNDDYTPMEFVVQVLETFFNKSREEATRIMLHVHRKGVGLCGVFTYEVAETKVSQVMAAARQAQHPLQCTMEKE